MSNSNSIAGAEGPQSTTADVLTSSQNNANAVLPAVLERVHLTKQEATDFFAEMYHGEHHLPSKVKEFGFGFCVEDFAGMATFDYSNLTRFVILCHDRCVRGEIRPSSPRSMKVCIWKRQGREGGMSDRHPTLEKAIENLRVK